MLEQMNLEINQEDTSIVSLAEELKSQMELLTLHLMIFLSKFLGKKKRNLTFVSGFFVFDDELVITFYFGLHFTHK